MNIEDKKLCRIQFEVYMLENFSNSYFGRNKNDKYQERFMEIRWRSFKAGYEKAFRFKTQ